MLALPGPIDLVRPLRKGGLEGVAALLTALSLKSPLTSGHCERVSRYAAMLALCLGGTESQVRFAERAGRLHDIGKLVINEGVLEKPGALTPDEWVQMKAHPELGAQILRSIPALASLLPAVSFHHERYDGKGYPYGIPGPDLPVESRIIGICDAYDTMTSDRPYRGALPAEEAMRRIREGAGTQFDPLLVDLFLRYVVKELPEGRL
jgi:putative nucleotidyltransferase with HDIG domain